MDFPLIKLAYLAARQASGPISAIIRERAKRSEFFRTKICMAPAQLFFKVDLKVRMMSKNLGKPINTPILSEKVAIDLGANLLGEFMLFFLGSVVLVSEYCRQARNTHAKEQKRIQENAQLRNALHSLASRLSARQMHIDLMSARIRNLSAGWFCGKVQLKTVEAEA